MYCLPETYEFKDTASQFDDSSNEDGWQKEVYSFALSIARRYNLYKISDFGCGSGFKLVNNFIPTVFDTVGIDIKSSVDKLNIKYPKHNWVISPCEDKVPVSIFSGAELIICSDVIEHLPRPDLFLATLKDSDAEYFVLSTPAREILVDRGHNNLGPSKNPAHFCEWSSDEFRRFVATFLDVKLHVISNTIQATQLLIATKKGKKTEFNLEDILI